MFVMQALVTTLLTAPVHVCKEAKLLHIFLHILHLLGYMVTTLRHAVAGHLALGRSGVQQGLSGFQSHLHQADEAAAVHAEGEPSHLSSCHKSIRLYGLAMGSYCMLT